MIEQIHKAKRAVGKGGDTCTEETLRSCSHLVVPEGRRAEQYSTAKVFRALSQWTGHERFPEIVMLSKVKRRPASSYQSTLIVTPSWVHDSLAAGYWVDATSDPEKYYPEFLRTRPALDSYRSRPSAGSPLLGSRISLSDAPKDKGTWSILESVVAALGGELLTSDGQSITLASLRQTLLFATPLGASEPEVEIEKPEVEEPEAEAEGNMEDNDSITPAANESMHLDTMEDDVAEDIPEIPEIPEIPDTDMKEEALPSVSDVRIKQEIVETVDSVPAAQDQLAESGVMQSEGVSDRADSVNKQPNAVGLSPTPLPALSGNLGVAGSSLAAPSQGSVDLLGGGGAEGTVVVPYLTLDRVTSSKVMPPVIQITKDRMLLGRGSATTHVDIQLDSELIVNNISRKHAIFERAMKTDATGYEVCFFFWWGSLKASVLRR